MNQINGINIYTEEEVETIKARVVSLNVTSTGENILEQFREEVQGSGMDEEYAVELYNKLAERIGFDTVESISKTFTVTVSYNGEDLLTVTEVQAADETEACDEVTNNLEVSDVELTFHIRYSGDAGNVSDSVSVDYDSSDITDALDVSAEED